MAYLDNFIVPDEVDLDDEEEEDREGSGPEQDRDRREGEAAGPDAPYEQDHEPDNEDALSRRLVSHSRSVHIPASRQNSEVDQHDIQRHLVQPVPPSINDFPLWRIRCRKGIEMDAVFHLGRHLEVQ